MNGSIEKRNTNTWRLMIELGRNATGKRLRKSVTVKGNKAQAQKRLRELLSSLDRGMPIDSSKTTVGEFLDQWLETYVKPNTSAKTHYDYSGMVRRYIKPKLGWIPLTQLSPQAIQGLHADMYEEGLSARSVQYTHKTLKQSLKHAVKWGMLARNVCDMVDAPNVKREEIHVLDLSNIHRLLDTTSGSIYGHIIHMAVYTGLRRGELLALRWSDVDLQNKTISVNQALTSIRGKGIVPSAPKTRNSRRMVSLSSTAAGLIRSLKAKRVEQYEAAGIGWNESTYIFCQSDGLPVRPDTVTHVFQRTARMLGFTNVHFHSLRHTHATLMLKAGVHPKIVSERLGHASVNITLDTYSHVLPGLQEAAAKAFDDMLARRPEKEPTGVDQIQRVTNMSPTDGLSEGKSGKIKAESL